MTDSSLFLIFQEVALLRSQAPFQILEFDPEYEIVTWSIWNSLIAHLSERAVRAFMHAF
jgi:hypothetical protein